MRTVVALKAFLAIAFWGSSFVASKVVLRELSPITIIVVRFALGLITLILIVGLGHPRASVHKVDRLHSWGITRKKGLLRIQDLGWFLLLSFNGIFVHQLLQVNGLARTTATNTGWMVALVPIFTALLAWRLLHEVFGPSQLVGLVLAAMGTLLVVSRGEWGDGVVGLSTTHGDMLAFLSAPNWAIFSVLSKRVLTRYPPSVMMTYTMGMGWLMLLPIFIGSAGWRELPGLTAGGWAGLLFLGLACSGVAYAFWYDALEAAPAAQVASFLYLEPLVTLVVAVLLLTERPTLATLVGGGLILAGVWLVNQNRD